MAQNKEATRYASKKQEERIAKKLGGKVNSNSGAGLWNKSDVLLEDASISIECKTCMTPKNSFSIKKEWIEKNQKELLVNRTEHSVIAFNFDFNSSKDYFVIDDKLMKFLVDKLEEDD